MPISKFQKIIKLTLLDQRDSSYGRSNNAHNACSLCAEDGLKKAQNATSVMFGREESTVQPLKELTERDLVALYSDASTTEMPLSLVGELTLADLAVRSGAVGKGECGHNYL